ncbi:MAG: hypothetical protein US58_C0024G0008 [Candidatus Magasanikbacteria bacterium GW2011_GWA2_37_8]|uniref:TraD/TraG TraM recognition site domain-containing protein n=1 Tax=Candidatus Magasanikbacteria bacterium GW2011_GWA2_37_8 TaxID=1619036 RepID=A0A0G0HCW8_9BACT|nr:MAG: hypothetical protein US58_C0024G0008 [Candidatus Magasanikbacteria bacterium GW2011_GWA2_37_8]
MLADEDYRRRVVRNIKDPVVKSFWQVEFAAYSDKYRQEAVAPIQNKIGQFLSASIIRNIVAQVKSRINIREIMDQKKIFIMNLSKGRIGEDSSRLLGGMLITKIQLSAMERVDIPEEKREDFFLYVDEFQNFATESFANILSEARKYRLALTLAHQYMEQLDETVLAAVIGNVGTTITFRVGSTDAEILAKEFAPVFIEEDLINLPKFQIYLKLMIDGVSSRPFSAMTLGPIAQATGSFEKVVKVSRERYAAEREQIEDKIARWSGMVIIPESEAEQLEVDPDEAMFGEEVKKEEKKGEEKEEEKKVEEKAIEPIVEPIAKSTVEPKPVAPSSPVSPTTPVIPVKTGIQSPSSVVSTISTPPVIPSERSESRNPLTPTTARPNTQLQSPKPDFKKKNKHKKKTNFAPHQGESVLLGNPNDRGISLTTLQPPKPVIQSVQPPVIARSEATKQSTPFHHQSPTITPPPSFIPAKAGIQSSPSSPPPSDLNIGFIPKQAPLSQSLKIIKPDQIEKIDDQF